MDLGAQLIEACRKRDLSLAAACRAADLKYSTLHAQISKGRAIPFVTIDRLARVLDLPLSYFAIGAHDRDAALDAGETPAALTSARTGRIDEKGLRLTTDYILDWLAANDARMTGDEPFIDHINLYYPAGPDDDIPRPYRIGPQSLTARYFHLLSIDRYSDVIAQFDVTSRAEIIRSHREVQNRDYLVTDHKIDALTENGRIRGTYRRVLAPVVMQGEQSLILQFSKLTHFSGG